VRNDRIASPSEQDDLVRSKKNSFALLDLKRGKSELKKGGSKEPANLERGKPGSRTRDFIHPLRGGRPLFHFLQTGEDRRRPMHRKTARHLYQEGKQRMYSLKLLKVPLYMR